MQKWLAAWFPEEVYGDNGILRLVIFNFGCSCTAAAGVSAANVAFGKVARERRLRKTSCKATVRHVLKRAPLACQHTSACPQQTLRMFQHLLSKGVHTCIPLPPLAQTRALVRFCSSHPAFSCTLPVSFCCWAGSSESMVTAACSFPRAASLIVGYLLWGKSEFFF